MSFNNELSKLTKEIEILKEEITNLKVENDKKVNSLVKVHLNELDDLKNENVLLRQNLTAMKDSFDATLVKRDEENKVMKQSLVSTKDSFDVTLASQNRHLVQTKEQLEEMINENKSLKIEVSEENERFLLKYKREKERALKFKRENITLLNHQANCDKCCT